MLSSVLLATLASAPAPPPDLQENVLLVILDDVGVDRVGAYGVNTSDVRTPVLDDLALNGVRFDRAWSNPTCSPTRAAMLTGKPAFRTGIGRHISANQIPLQTSEPTIAKDLPLGVNAAAIGKWHLGDTNPCGASPGDEQHPISCGFRVYEGCLRNIKGGTGCNEGFEDWPETYADSTIAKTEQNKNYATSETTDDALDRIAALGDNPWFLWVAFNASHIPLHMPPAGLHSYDLTNADDTTLMLAMTEALDMEIGRLLDGIDPAVRARTNVIVIGDNGTVWKTADAPYNTMGRGKGSLYEGGVRVPLIVSGPIVEAAGTAGSTCDGLVQATDIYATVLEVFGVTTSSDPDQDAVSFLPYLSNPAQPSLRSVHYTERFSCNFDPTGGISTTTCQELENWGAAISDGRWKLIQRRQGVGDLVFEEFYDLTANPADPENPTFDLLTSDPVADPTCPVPPELQGDPVAATAFATLCAELDALRQ